MTSNPPEPDPARQPRWDPGLLAPRHGSPPRHETQTYPTSSKAQTPTEGHLTAPSSKCFRIVAPTLLLKRPDITGARWGLDGAEAILTLRAVLSNGDFDDYWRYHLTQEHQRLYPGTTQGQCSLSVALTLTPNEPHPSAIRATPGLESGHSL